MGPAALQARHQALAPQLADNPFGAQLALQSQEARNRLEGDVYAVLDHPLDAVAAALSEPARWCDVLILHLNTKYCRHEHEAGDAVRLDVRVGKKTEQALGSATRVQFEWQPPQSRAGYFVASMAAPDGPYDTNNYTLLVEAVPLDGGRTFLHMGYGFGFAGASSFAMKMYLATIGAGKVGFSTAGTPPQLVGGMRGVVERNTMRYYLAIRCYLDSLKVPAAQRVDQRFAAWFDATEKYARQLHEVDREEYLRMKRNEYARQVAAR
ncbi:hypothetical protein H8R02_21085 [Ramlibacter sp. GTP1]|uniref:Uncharacterized protein n=2 Tax=Ramlibacter albus TaxID=2079448 RepID=A0A923MCP5_9BURK|nr:hypothetical protein [Ramlibacter albus]